MPTSAIHFSPEGDQQRNGSNRDMTEQRIPTTPVLTGLSRKTTSHRRGSNASYTSYNTSGMRNRRKSRANTVTTYHEPDQPNWQPGAEPGIDVMSDRDEPHLDKLRAPCDISIVDFSHEYINQVQANNDTLMAALEPDRPEASTCRWISVNGLSGDVIKFLGHKYGMHRLAIEDMINTRSRTKVDWYSDHAFAVLTLQKLVRVHSHDDTDNCDCYDPDYDDSKDEIDLQKSRSQSRSRKSWWRRMLSKSKSASEVLPRHESDPVVKMDEFVNAHTSTSSESPIAPIRTLHRYEGTQNPEHTVFMEKNSALAQEDMIVSVEQVSIFLLADNTVISYFEHSAADVEAPILDRLVSTETMLRRSGDASLLVEAIIDAIVDLAIPVKDAYNKARKDLQIDVLTNPDIGTAKSLHIFNEEIDMLQNLFKPIVQLVNALRDHNTDPMTPSLINASALPRHRNDHRHRGAVHSQRSSDSLANSEKRSASSSSHTAASTSVVITPLAHTYLGDVLDHCITIIQSLEQMDASANNLSSLIFNTVGANTNNFMMILALVTVFFAPLTFFTGYYGMNFVRQPSVLDHSDAFFWYTSMPVTAVFILLVGGGILKRSTRNWLAELHIRRTRKERKRVRRAGESAMR